MGSGSHPSKRKKKRSQKLSKKRSKGIKKKTKKLKRRHDSVSNSDDDSASSLSVSCSSSSLEGDSRGKRLGRSRDRKRRKGRKKRTERSSSESESSGDSPCVKKRKRTKRKRDSELRKKRRKKIRKREPSISTSSEKSNSCSSCEPSNDDERKRGKKKEKSELMEREGRVKSRERSMSKRSRRSSRSWSPGSLPSESHSYHSEERVMEENYPKRLKSVIVAVFEREETEIGESNRDGHKDEIVYEHDDDYPSRSNDSNDGVTKREELPYSDDASYEKTMSMEEPNRKVVTSDVGTSEFSGSEKLDMERTGRITSDLVGSGASDPLKENNSGMSSANAGSNPGNLEAILRQKALENLLKRQSKLPAKIPADNKDDNSIEVKKSSSMKNEPVWNRLNEEGSIKSAQNFGRGDDVKQTADPPMASTDHHVRPPSRKLDTCLPTKKANASDHLISRPKLVSPTPIRRFLGSSNTWKRDLALQESPKLNQSLPKESTGTDSAKGSDSPLLVTKLSAEKVDKRTGTDSAKGSDSPLLVTKLSAEKVDSILASEPSPSGEKSSKDETDEADEDSQFQQKTMTVMRGGELVQVSYKVKIPKKAPALARRQLKR